jgi:hypothetical protein
MTLPRSFGQKCIGGNLGASTAQAQQLLVMTTTLMAVTIRGYANAAGGTPTG